MSFSTSEVAAIADVTRRQLQWWDERGLVVSGGGGGRGTPRIYHELAAMQAMVIADLRRKGFAPKLMRPVLQFLKRELAPALEDSGDGTLYLIVAGEDPYLESTEHAVLDRVFGAKSGAYVVKICDLLGVRKLENSR